MMLSIGMFIKLAKSIWDAVENYKSTDEYNQMRKEFEK